MWGQLLIWGLSVLVSILTAPKIPKQKDAQPDLKEFNSPTAEEGRAIPVIFGKQKITGSNVIWWGDLGFYDTDKFQAGIHQIYCLSPIDRITAIWDGDKKYSVSHTANAVSTVLADADSYNGSLYIEFGEPNQTVNAYLDHYSATTGETTNPLYRQTGYIPSFRGFFGTVWQGKLAQEGSNPTLGTSPNPSSLSVELTRTQRQSDFSTQWLISKAEVGSNGAMNAVHIIREVLTSKVWGLGIEEARIGDSFQSYAVLAFNEGYGLGITLDRGSVEVNDFIQQICKYIDGFVYPDNNGVYQILLARDNYDSDDLTEFDESDYLEIKSFTRGTAFQMTNQIALTYTDPTTWTKKTIYAHDLAAINKQGSVISTSINREWVLDVELARKMAAYELRKATSQLAKCTIIGNRSFSNLNPGDVFKLSNADLGLVNIIFRVLKTDRGEYENNKVELQVIEDIFAIGQGLYAPPNSTTYDAAENDPLQSNRIFIDEIPYYILENEFADYSPPTTNYGLVMTLQSKPSSECLYYKQNLGTVSGTLTEYENGYFAYYNTLMNSLGYTQVSAVALDMQIDSDYSSLTDIYAIIQDTDYGSYEIILIERFNAVSKTMEIKRGLFDTVPQFHPAGSTVWFSSISTARGSITQQFVNGLKYIKLLNQTNLGGVLLTDATEYQKTLVKRAMLPNRPKYLRVNNSSMNDYGYGYVVPYADDITITWKHSTRLETSTIYDAYETTSETPEVNQVYEIKLYYYDGSAIRTLTSTEAGESSVYTKAMRVSDFGADLFFDMIIVVSTTRSGYTSYQSWTYKMIQYNSANKLDYDYSGDYIKVFMGGFSAESDTNKERGLGFKQIKYEYSTDGYPPKDPTALSRNYNTTSTYIEGSEIYTHLLKDKSNLWAKFSLYRPDLGIIGNSVLDIIRLRPTIKIGGSSGAYSIEISMNGYFSDSIYFTYSVLGVPDDPTDGDTLYTGKVYLAAGGTLMVKARGIKGGYQSAVRTQA